MPKQAKQVDYSQLYYDKEIEVSHPEVNHGSPIDLSIELRDFNNVPDCRVGHFGYNFYFRTNAGMKKRAYKSRSALERAVVRLLEARGFKVRAFVQK